MGSFPKMDFNVRKIKLWDGSRTFASVISVVAAKKV
jgi:hypothetical protein